MIVVKKKEKRIAMSTKKRKIYSVHRFFSFFKLFHLSIFPSEMRLRLSTEDDPQRAKSALLSPKFSTKRQRKVFISRIFWRCVTSRSDQRQRLSCLLYRAKLGIFLTQSNWLSPSFFRCCFFFFLLFSGFLFFSNFSSS